MLILFLFFGNDFVPNMKNIIINEYNIDLLFFSYVFSINKYKINIYDNIKTNTTQCF